MALERKHKIIIGGASSLIVIYLIVNSVFLYLLFVKINVDYNSLDKQLSNAQADSQSKINELTITLLKTQENIGSLSSQVDKLKSSTSADFSGIIENAIKAVVTIRTDVAQGTGFIITSDGYIVTNAHVLAGASKVSATTSDQITIEASFIGFNGQLDIALLKISGNYEILNLANSDEVQIGEKVIAIGNPLGLQFSVSEGIVSAVHRIGENKLKAYIQTDAALNPGNSGGPLINKAGEAIGMNNFKVSGGENLGFAIESNYIRDIVNKIALEAINKTLI